ncbi:hypothetical protein [Terasakiella sp.]|uniref:hypothetical protein n=1 Tax=Terasakiella sp. TaxID=2034861 RepID=UPI003AA96FE1
MVYVKVGGEYADVCFNHLKLFLHMIDNELSNANVKIKQSADPDSDGLYDLTEYLIGYGFVAIQRYISSTYPQTCKDKSQIYKIGQKLKNDLYLVEVVNAGANYWKHEPEWPFDLIYGQTDINGLTPISVNRSGDNLQNMQKKTFGIITQLTPHSDYTLSNLLTEILQQLQLNSEISFSPLLPFIENWRTECEHE